MLDVMQTFAEGGANYSWWSLPAYRWFDPDLDGGTAEPGEGNTRNVVLKVKGENPRTEGWLPVITVTPDTLAAVFEKLAGPTVDGWNTRDQSAALGAYHNNEAGDIDADAADCIFQILVFGSIIFG